MRETPLFSKNVDKTRGVCYNLKCRKLTSKHFFFLKRTARGGDAQNGSGEI